MTNGRNQYAPFYRQILIDSFGGKCEAQGCSETFGLEFAHVIATSLTTAPPGKHEGRGRKERQTDIAKNRSAYLLLCGTHHDLLTKMEKKFGSLAGSRRIALLNLANRNHSETWIIGVEP